MPLSFTNRVLMTVTNFIKEFCDVPNSPKSIFVFTGRAFASATVRFYSRGRFFIYKKSHPSCDPCFLLPACVSSFPPISLVSFTSPSFPLTVAYLLLPPTTIVSSFLLFLSLAASVSFLPPTLVPISLPSAPYFF